MKAADQPLPTSRRQRGKTPAAVPAASAARTESLTPPTSRRRAADTDPDGDPPKRGGAFAIGLSMVVMAGAGMLFISMFSGRPAQRSTDVPVADDGSTAVAQQPPGTSLTTTLASADGPSGPTPAPNTRESGKPASTPSRATEPSAQAPGSRSVVGETIAVGPYGPLRVSITMEGTRILSVSVPTYPKGGTSSTINSKAVPQLVRQAMAIQSAGVDGVSGATLTSVAFRQSLQHAINRARA